MTAAPRPVARTDRRESSMAAPSVTTVSFGCGSGEADLRAAGEVEDVRAGVDGEDAGLGRPAVVGPVGEGARLEADGDPLRLAGLGADDGVPGQPAHRPVDGAVAAGQVELDDVLAGPEPGVRDA